MTEDVHVVLSRRPDWDTGVRRLRLLWEKHGRAASERAAKYGAVYAGRRGSMVFDVVASRQRKYQPRVLDMVARWERAQPDGTLAALAAGMPEQATYGLRAGEAETMGAVAQNLLDLSHQLNLGEEDACATWAGGVGMLEHAHGLDPVVGSVRGIGPALFAYMRMRCGADALKPDLRVRDALRSVGFAVPSGEHEILVMARAIAHELGITALELDQLLWWPDR